MGESRKFSRNFHQAIGQINKVLRALVAFFLSAFSLTHCQILSLLQKCFVRLLQAGMTQ